MERYVEIFKAWSLLYGLEEGVKYMLELRQKLSIGFGRLLLIMLVKGIQNIIHLSGPIRMATLRVGVPKLCQALESFHAHEIA